MLIKSDHVLYRSNYGACFYLPFNGFTLIPANRPSSSWRCSSHLFLQLQNFLLSGFTGTIFFTIGKGKMAWEMRPKYSQGIPKPE